MEAWGHVWTDVTPTAVRTAQSSGEAAGVVNTDISGSTRERRSGPGRRERLSVTH